MEESFTKEEEIKITTPADDPDAESNVQNGRVIFFILGGFMLLITGMTYSWYNDVSVIIINSPVALIFLAFGIFYYRNPYFISIAGLTLYLLLLITQIIIDPSSYSNNILIRALIIFALVRCIKFARYYKVTIKPKENNLLDDDL